MEDKLEGLFEEYKSDLSILSLNVDVFAEFWLIVPLEMVDKYKSILGHNKREPVSFWKDMKFRERLLQIPELQNANGRLSDALGYLNNICASFELNPNDVGKIILYVRETAVH